MGYTYSSNVNFNDSQLFAKVKKVIVIAEVLLNHWFFCERSSRKLFGLLLFFYNTTKNRSMRQFMYLKKNVDLWTQALHLTQSICFNPETIERVRRLPICSVFLIHSFYTSFSMNRQGFLHL